MISQTILEIMTAQPEWWMEPHNFEVITVCVGGLALSDARGPDY